MGFLRSIGIAARWGAFEPASVIPGVLVAEGELVVEAGKLLWPGDLLHEAGHLAILEPTRRKAVDGDFGADGGYEMAAIAWSWAALKALGLDAHVLFHDGGYRGGAAALRENFMAGRYVGVPILEWLGLTAQGDHASQLGVDPYPSMIRWVV